MVYRSSGRHRPANEINSLGLAETMIRHAPQPAADDEVATVRRHRMLHNALEHDPEKWIPVFRKDHAQTKRWSAMLIQPKRIAL
jgi:hypothetical protein